MTVAKWSRRRKRVIPPESTAARADARQAVMNARTHCHRGHELTPENTVWTITQGQRTGRICLACETDWERRNR